MRHAMLEACRVVLEVYHSNDAGIRYKDEREPVTEADLAANRVLQNLLMQALPEAGWLSEESERNYSDLAKKELLWVVDPIDGTSEFIKKNDEFSVSVGLVRHGKPIWGAVALPAESIVVACEENGVATWSTNGEVSSANRPLEGHTVALDEARICVSRTEWKNGLFKSQSSRLKIRPEGSVARKLALVSIGRYDLTASLYPKNDWDIAGGMALIEAAGGQVCRPDTGEPITLSPSGESRPGLVCGPPGLVKEYCRYFAEEGLRLRNRYGAP
jgi:myo-inositol-1(or 4)-monophosphatase